MSKFVTFLIILFCFLVGLFGIFNFLKSSKTQPAEAETESVTAPSPISAKPQEVHSLDGKMNLTRFFLYLALLIVITKCAGSKSTINQIATSKAPIYKIKLLDSVECKERSPDSNLFSSPHFLTERT